METEKNRALLFHEKLQGKWEVQPRTELTPETLALAYTPGVAQPCLAIAENPDLADVYTRRGNTVAVVTDGSAILGLGDIGPIAGLPVMEGKAVLFKCLSGLDAVPILLSVRDVDAIVDAVAAIAPGFGGINLEDISAPRCFEVERRLAERLSIPVFHDDQHGTAIVVGAAFINACQLTGRDMADVRVVIQGAGAAGLACAQLLMELGVCNLLLVDKAGILTGDMADIHEEQRRLARQLNPLNKRGDIQEALKGADVFIGVSGPDSVPPEAVAGMREKAIVFALANPRPEIQPEQARSAGAYIVATGRSDDENQINNVLAFPGVFKGAMTVKASQITKGMKLAACSALAQYQQEKDLGPNRLLPRALHMGVVAAIGDAVAAQAKKEGVAQG